MTGEKKNIRTFQINDLCKKCPDIYLIKINCQGKSMGLSQIKLEGYKRVGNIIAIKLNA